MALNRKWIASPCYHGRDYNQVRMLVLHTAEGATTIESLGNYFSNYGNQVSSHVGADDKRGIIGEYVSRGNAAWTQANYNNDAVSLELCGFAHWSRNTWMNEHHNMLLNCADWIREEAGKAGISIISLNDSQSQGNGKGVTQHIRLGPGGGGHVDCGSGFPMDYVIDLAKGQTPPPDTEEDDSDMFYLSLAVNPDGSINNDASLSFTNDQKDGKHKVRFACRIPQHLRVDFTAGATVEGDITYGVTWGPNIPEGAAGAVVHIDTGDPREPIAVSIGKA